jgi:hypothetical protein
MTTFSLFSDSMFMTAQRRWPSAYTRLASATPSCATKRPGRARACFWGLCEGLPSDASGIRRRHFDIANNSLHEVIGAVDLADAIGAIDPDAARELLALAIRVKRMLRALPR